MLCYTWRVILTSSKYPYVSLNRLECLDILQELYKITSFETTTAVKHSIIQFPIINLYQESSKAVFSALSSILHTEIYSKIITQECANESFSKWIIKDFLIDQGMVVRNDWIKTIQMGPITQKLDEGLEIRKSSLSSLLLLIETFFSTYLNDADILLGFININFQL